METISNILKDCRYYNVTNFNRLSKNILNHNKPFISIVFNNIDGNASNFDSFITDMSQYDEKFGVIALAETNIDEENKDLYKIDGYSSEYNSKTVGKKKGSGLGIYIDNKYQYS